MSHTRDQRTRASTNPDRAVLGRLPTPFTASLVLLLMAFTGSAQASSLTRTSAFDYDPSTGLLNKEIIEPGDSTLCVVTTYGRDAWGNKTSSTARNCNGSAGSSPGNNSEAATPVAGSVADIERFRIGKLFKFFGILLRGCGLMAVRRFDFCCCPISVNRNAFLKCRAAVIASSASVEPREFPAAQRYRLQKLCAGAAGLKKGKQELQGTRRGSKAAEEGRRIFNSALRPPRWPGTAAGRWRCGGSAPACGNPPTSRPTPALPVPGSGG